MRFRSNLFSTILMLPCFFLIGLGLQEGVLAGTVQLPKTGQTTCYDTNGTVTPCAGTGQDGDIQAGVAWPDPRFTVSGDCVSDNLTGLMWAQNANLPNGTRNWQGALDFVASLNTGSGVCGYTDWRLPNVNELESLVHEGQSNSALWLNTQGFTNVQNFNYWSSSSIPINTNIAWSIDMQVGIVGGVNKTDDFYVWPVRSIQGVSSDNSNIWRTGQTTSFYPDDDGALQKGVIWPASRFTDNNNQTITDNLTGLIWSKDANTPGMSQCNPGVTKTWQEALDYVTCLNTNQYLGYKDWRVPNRKELYTLIDFSKYGPPIHTGHPFINVQLYRYWSSTSLAGGTNHSNYAWIIIMNDGEICDNDKGYIGYVWPVRSGQGGPANNFQVTPSIGNGAGHGTISPDTPQTVDQDSTTTFTVNPAVGYTASVGGTCGGNLVGNTYTTNPITGPCTVVANFTLGGSISGRVTDASGNGIAGVVVKAYDLNGNFIKDSRYAEKIWYDPLKQAIGIKSIFDSNAFNPYTGRSDGFFVNTVPVSIDFNSDHSSAGFINWGFGTDLQSGILTAAGVYACCTNNYYAPGLDLSSNNVSQIETSSFVTGEGAFGVVFIPHVGANGVDMVRFFTDRWDVVNGASTIYVQSTNADHAIIPVLLENLSSISYSIDGLNWLSLSETPSSINMGTDDTGNYIISPLPPGSYRLYFQPSQTGQYLSEWYNNKTTQNNADSVSLVAGQTTANINAQLNSTDITSPALSITSHTNGQTVTTASFTVSGTASDSGKGDNGISQVTVNGIRASGDTSTGSGTANWSKAITLSLGTNTIEVIAYDNSPNLNSTTQSITITYDPSSQTFSISGMVTDPNGGGLAGVVMNGLPGSPTTGISGAYTATVNYGWSGTVTPNKDCYNFIPASKIFTNVMTNQTHYYASVPQTGTYQFVTKWGAYGSGDGQFGYPGGIAISPAGNVYVVDKENYRIQEFDSEGIFIT